MINHGNSTDDATRADRSDILSRMESTSSKERKQRSIIAFKVSHALVSIFFCWILIVQIIGFLLFAKGFLLTRLVLDNKSDCHILPDGSSIHLQDGCWHPKVFEKAVVIIIDALRYDFTIPSKVIPDIREPSFYHDNIPFLYDLAVQKPENAILRPFIADPPTSTLQRLKGLTTGTLPTFIDIGSNFAGTAIEEDNLVSQLKKNGKTLVHLGDDTWHALFPGYFDSNLTHAYDSFNVWDLHTVDNGVIKHIMPLLRGDHSAHWDVIFAHFLGVDHAGHRYGPNHPAMSEKLQQMNTVLQDIVEHIDDDTLLVVMGDHGMDTKGDHGGESDDEIEAALWMYSKISRFGQTDSSTSIPPPTAKERSVGQIDLVSTLSLLLGMPIPFNNLGSPISEVFAGAGRTNWPNLAAVDLLAFRQIQNYQNEYSQARELDKNSLQDEYYWRVRNTTEASKNHDWMSVHHDYKRWHGETIQMYRNLWANFNISDMLHGIEVLSLGLLLLLGTAILPDAHKSEFTTSILRSAGLGIFAGSVCGSIFGLVVPQHMSLFVGALYGSATGGLLLALLSMFRMNRKSFDVKWPSLWDWLSIVFCVSQAAGFASNSYTIHEDTILLFFLNTFALVSLVSSLRQKSQPDRILGAYQSVVFLLLTRLASYSRLCREEQMPGCRSTFYASSTSSTSAPWQLMIPFAIALILPEIVKAFYKGTASYAASAGFWIGFSFRMGLLLVAAYWTIDAADNGNWLSETISSATLKTVSITLARCALAIAFPVGIATFIWAKPCIEISLNDNAQASSNLTDRQLKPQITIMGYANTFGSRYFLFIPVMVLSVNLLLPPMGQLAFAICTWQILCLLEILDTNGLTIGRSSSSSTGPIVLAMLGSYHFFKTGHQAVLSSIQWNAAFVPLRTIRYPWSPILIMLNSLGPQIICAAAVPLTVLWKRPISKSGLQGIWSDITNASVIHILYYATIQLATTLWAGHLRRHLMLYRIFMPRFLLASMTLMVVEAVLICVSLMTAKTTGLSVGEVFGY